MATLTEEPCVAVAETAIRQAPLGMALLGPGVAEIDEEAVYFAGRKNIFQPGHVEAQELDVVHFGCGALLAGIIEDADLSDVDADKLVKVVGLPLVMENIDSCQVTVVGYYKD